MAEIEAKSATKFALRGGKLKSLGSKVLAGVRLSAKDSRPVQDRIKETLTNNAVRIVDVFKEWDVDNSGTVSKAEFRKAMPLLGLSEVDPKEVDALFDTLDREGAGAIGHKELSKMLRPQTGFVIAGGADVPLQLSKASSIAIRRDATADGKRKPLMASLFRQLGSGEKELTVERMRDALVAGSIRVLDVFHEWDEDCDGVVGRDEFVNAMAQLEIVETDKVEQLWTAFGSATLVNDKALKRPDISADDNGITYRQLNQLLRPVLGVSRPDKVGHGEAAAAARRTAERRATEELQAMEQDAGRLRSDPMMAQLINAAGGPEALLLNSSRILKLLRLRAAMSGGGEGGEGGKVTKQDLREALTTLGLGTLTPLVETYVDDFGGADGIGLKELGTAFRFGGFLKRKPQQQGKARPPGLHGHASHQKREHASRLGKMYSEPRPLSPPHLAPISPQSSFIGVPQNAIEERAHHDAVATQWSAAHLTELQAARSELQAARPAASLEANQTSQASQLSQAELQQKRVGGWDSHSYSIPFPRGFSHLPVDPVQVMTGAERRVAGDEAAGGARNKASALPALQGPKTSNAKLAGRTGSVLLRNMDIDESSDKSYQNQIRDALSKNAVRVIDLFREWDEDGNGTVSKKEFRKAMPMLGLQLLVEEVDGLYDSWDPDGSGMLELKELEKLLRRGSAVELDPRLKQGAMGAIETKSRTKSACKVAGGDGDSDSDGDGDGDSAFLTGVDGGGGGEVGAAAAAPMKGSRSLPILRSSIGRQVVSEYSTARIVIFSTTHRWPRPSIEKRPSPGDYTLANAFGHQSDSNLRSVGGAIFAKSGSGPAVLAKRAAAEAAQAAAAAKAAAPIGRAAQQQSVAAQVVSGALMLKLKAKQAVVRALFEQWDKDGDGQVTRKELRAGLQGLEIEISKGELNEIFAAFDPDGSGQIDFRELNKMLRSGGKVEQAGGAGPTPPQTTKPLRGGGEREGSSAVMASFKLKEGKDAPQVQDQIRDALSKNAVRVIDLFREWDKNQDGTVSKKEFRVGVEQMGFDVPKADVHGLFDSWDPDGSGLLDLTELHRVLRKGGKLEKKGKMIHPDTITVAELMQPGSPNASGRTALRKEKAKRASALGTIDLEEGDASRPVQEQLRHVLTSNAVRVIDLFREWDEDGDGTVSKKEFRKAMPMLGLEVSKQDINALFDSWDPDGSGMLELGELNKVLRRWGDVKLDAKLQAGAAGKILGRSETKHKLRKDSVKDKKGKGALAGVTIEVGSSKGIQEQIRDALTHNAVRVIDLFHSWDEDGDGTVSKKEFRKALPMLGIQVAKAEVDALFDSWDPDGSGQLELKELNKLLRRGNVVVELKNALMQNEEVLAALLDIAENGDGHVYKKDFIRTVRTIKPLGGKAEAKDVASLFDSWDASKDGSLEIHELTRHLSPQDDDTINKAGLRKGGATKRGSALSNIDLDEDSGVPYQEQLRNALSSNAVRVIDLFREWDEDESGTVSKKEFRKAMPMLGLDVPVEDVEALFDSWDPDGSGMLELKELTRVLKGMPAVS